MQLKSRKWKATRAPENGWKGQKVKKRAEEDTGEGGWCGKEGGEHHCGEEGEQRLCRKEPKVSTSLPEGLVAHLGGRDMGSLEALMCGMHNGNT